MHAIRQRNCYNGYLPRAQQQQLQSWREYETCDGHEICPTLSMWDIYNRFLHFKFHVFQKFSCPRNENKSR